jgi:hypothetical protein
MFLRKLSAGSVEALCMVCQVLSEYALADMKAANRSVSFPSCPACQKVRLQVNVIAGPIAKTGAAALSQAWIKALHRQLIVDGHTAAIYSAEKVAPDAHEGAVDWPTGDAVVTFVVPSIGEP